MADAPESRAFRTFHELVSAGRSLAYVRTAEESRVVALLREVAAKLYTPPAPLFVWSLPEGLRKDGAKVEKGDKPLAPRAALEAIAAHDGAAIFLLKDFHDALREPDVRRRLRDLYPLCRDAGKLVVITSPVKDI